MRRRRPLDRKLTHVVLATGNRGKLGDFRLLFEGSGIELSWPEDHGLDLEVEETGETFEANALLKARAYGEALSLPVMADDSGLSVQALGGEPGVYSARYAGPEGDPRANNAKLLEKMRGIDDRRAAFVCVLALITPDGRELVVDGRCEGLISDSERGGVGFGYDPVFYCEELGCTFGEATPEDKNARSHRGAAVRAMLELLRNEGLA